MSFFPYGFVILAVVIWFAYSFRRRSREVSLDNAGSLLKRGKREAGKTMLRTLAEKGDTKACTILAVIEMQDKNLDEAETLLTSAAEKGNQDAQKFLNEIKLQKIKQEHNPGKVWDDAMTGCIPGFESPEERKTVAQRIAANDAMAARIFDVVTGEYTRDGVLDRRTALSALGAMAGFGCQIGIRDGLIASGKITERDAFVVVDTKSGDKYYFGDLPNRPLFEFPVSVHSWILGGLMKAGSNAKPDIEATARRVVASVGTDAFFILDVPEKDQPAESPLESLRRLWPKLYPEIRAKYGPAGTNGLNPNELGWFFAIAAQRVIALSKDGPDLETEGKIVFEAAVRMAKIDPEKVK